MAGYNHCIHSQPVEYCNYAMVFQPFDWVCAQQHEINFSIQKDKWINKNNVFVNFLVLCSKCKGLKIYNKKKLMNMPTSFTLHTALKIIHPTKCMSSLYQEEELHRNLPQQWQTSTCQASCIVHKTREKNSK